MLGKPREKVLAERKGHDQRVIDLSIENDARITLINSLMKTIDSSSSRGRNYYPALRTYSGETLRLLMDTFQGNPKGLSTILDEAGTGSSPDTFIRERIMYPVSSSAPLNRINRSYCNARSSLKVTDLTLVASQHVDGVTAVLTVSLFMENPQHGSGFNSGIPMTPNLASILMESPDRYEDVIQYIDNRWEALQDPRNPIDTTHLREVLANSSRPLSSGVL